MKRTLLQTLVLGLTVAGLSAGDLPADIQAKFIKILAGDKVLLELSQYDLTRGRIVWRYK